MKTIKKIIIYTVLFLFFGSITNAQNKLKCEKLIKQIDSIQAVFRNLSKNEDHYTLPPIILTDIFSGSQKKVTFFDAVVSLKNDAGGTVLSKQTKSLLVLLRCHIEELCALNKMSEDMSRQFGSVLRQLQKENDTSKTLRNTVDAVFKMMESSHLGTPKDSGDTSLWGLVKNINTNDSAIKSILDLSHLGKREDMGDTSFWGKINNMSNKGDLNKRDSLLKDYISRTKDTIIHALKKDTVINSLPHHLVLAAYYAETTGSLSYLRSFYDSKFCFSLGALIKETNRNTTQLGVCAGFGIIRDEIAFVPEVIYIDDLSLKNRWSWHALIVFMQKKFTVGLGYSPLIGLGAQVGLGF